MDELRTLPKVDALSRAKALERFPERVRVAAARRVVAAMREAIRSGGGLDGHTPEEMAVRAAELIEATSLRPAINLSGVILHTGLGRARLAPSVAEHVAAVARAHSTVELDAETGKRGDRQEHVRELLMQLTGAEDAHVVNNAAAAVVLSLSALASGREVILSRGQMVEIGGSFRMPEIVVQSGCRLVEVGCTNKTRLSDYTKAIGEQTGAILRCHTSNFAIVGFAGQPSLGELAKLGVAVIDDMGTGCIVDLSPFGLPAIPTIQGSLKAGADVVTASGDKLLGGPQAGLILGRRELIEKIRVHPLARALRVDKLTLAALEATLRLYATGRQSDIPTIRYISRPLDEVREFAVRLSTCVRNSTVAQGTTAIGGGSSPDAALATWRLGLSGRSPDKLLQTLREADPPIIGRIEDDVVWLDPRTLDDDEVEIVCEVLRSL